MNLVTDDLIAWLNQQIDEDERTAKAATPGPWRVADVTDYGSAGASAIVIGPDVVKSRGIDPQTGLYREYLEVLGPVEVTPADCDYGPSVDLVDVEHMVRQDPPRVLREVAAKRAIIDNHHQITIQSEANTDELASRTLRGARWTDDAWATKQTQLRRDGWYFEGARRASIRALLGLALAYEDRPGYRDEWRLT